MRAILLRIHSPAIASDANITEFNSPSLYVFLMGHILQHYLTLYVNQSNNPLRSIEISDANFFHCRTKCCLRYPSDRALRSSCVAGEIHEGEKENQTLLPGCGDCDRLHALSCGRTGPCTQVRGRSLMAQAITEQLDYRAGGRRLCRLRGSRVHREPAQLDGKGTAGCSTGSAHHRI